MMKVTSLVFPWITPKVPRAEPLLHRPKPPQGWRVLSVAGCVGTDGGAGVGMILRSDKGWPKFAEWLEADALEAEASAVKEGMERALTYTEKPIILQSSCANFLSSVTSMKDDGSKLARIFTEIHALKERREVIFMEISREQNSVAHCLAEHGRSDMSTTFCLEHVPDFVSSLVSSDRYAVSVE